MSIRMRKSFNLGNGVRVNVSKSGIGASVGVKGAKITKTANGAVRKTVSVPGTGLSYVSQTKKTKKNNVSRQGATKAPLGLFGIVLRVLAVVMFAMGALLALVEPVMGIGAIIFGVAEWVIGGKMRKAEKKAKSST